MRDYLLGALIGFVLITALPLQAQQAATCQLNFADGATISGVRQFVVTASAPALTNATLTVGGSLVPMALQVSGSATPSTPATTLTGTAWFDTAAVPDGLLTVVATIYNGATVITSGSRGLQVKNTSTPATLVGTPVALSFGFRGSGAAKLVDVGASQVADLQAVTAFTDVASTIRLVQGTGPFCGTNRANLTRAYPAAPNTPIVLLPPPAALGQAVCVYFLPNAPAGSALVQGDLRGVIR